VQYGRMFHRPDDGSKFLAGYTVLTFRNTVIFPDKIHAKNSFRHINVTINIGFLDAFQLRACNAGSTNSPCPSV
jgi:hypothetical protein